MDYWKIVVERAEVETTGESEGRGDDRNNNIIPPSNVPDMLPTMSVQDIWSKEVTITPREVAPQIAIEKTDVERIEEGSDEESEEEEKRTWKISRVEMENMRKVVVRDMFRMPSDDDEEDAPVMTGGPAVQFLGATGKLRKLEIMLIGCTCPEYVG